jgi:hypothetical protein
MTELKNVLDDLPRELFYNIMEYVSKPYHRELNEHFNLEEFRMYYHEKKHSSGGCNNNLNARSYVSCEAMEHFSPLRILKLIRMRRKYEKLAS